MKSRVAALEMACRMARRLRERRADGIDMGISIPYIIMYLVYNWMKYMNAGVDVIVVGAGPVGLLTAIELSLGGVHVVVLERLAAPSMVLKAGGIGALGIEALQRRGMAADIAAAQARAMAMVAQFGGLNDANHRGQGVRYSGHF